MAASSRLTRKISTYVNSIHKSCFSLSSTFSSPLNRTTVPPQFRFSDNPTSAVLFSSHSSNFEQLNAPAAINYSALLHEDEFHKLADATIHDLLEKIEEYGDSVDIDGFDIDYGNQVLTVKFGNLGTYVLNKQTPNRQIWMSSPVSGPSRFDWDQSAEAWIYRRTKAKLFETLENEIQQLCSYPIKLS